MLLIGSTPCLLLQTALDDSGFDRAVFEHLPDHSQLLAPPIATYGSIAFISALEYTLLQGLM